MDEQAEVVILRCRECRRLRPADTPTALLRLLRTAEGRWQVDRWERLEVTRRPWAIGVSPIGDPRYGLGLTDATQLYPVPVRIDGETVTVSCRWCDRPPEAVKYARVGRRALARGVREVDR